MDEEPGNGTTQLDNNNIIVGARLATICNHVIFYGGVVPP